MCLYSLHGLEPAPDTGPGNMKPKLPSAPFHERRLPSDMASYCAFPAILRSRSVRAWPAGPATAPARKGLLLAAGTGARPTPPHPAVMVQIKEIVPSTRIFDNPTPNQSELRTCFPTRQWFWASTLLMGRRYTKCLRQLGWSTERADLRGENPAGQDLLHTQAPNH